MARAKLLISINSCWNFVNFRSGLVRALRQAGYDIVAVAPEDPYVDRLEALGCRYVPIGMDARGTSPLGEARLLARYVAILRRERPDVYLGYTIKPNVYGSLAAHLAGVPVINNVAGLGEAFLKAGWLNRVARRLYSAALGKARVVFFQNPDDRDLFVRQGLVDSSASRLLPGSGVDLDRFAPDPADGARDGAGPVFLMLARLLWSKGVGEYAEVAGRIRRAHPEARFQLLGIPEEGKGGVEEERLRLWQDEGRIEYLGAAEDVRPHIGAATCIVLPTHYPEGTPRSLLEAAAMARPLIATDVPGCRQIVEDGVNGYLCPPRDVEGLERVVGRFLGLSEAERRALGRASRRKAEQQFDERIVIDAYLAAIAEILAEPRSGRRR